MFKPRPDTEIPISLVHCAAFGHDNTLRPSIAFEACGPLRRRGPRRRRSLISHTIPDVERHQLLCPGPQRRPPFFQPRAASGAST
jgi:hypothetical protein